MLADLVTEVRRSLEFYRVQSGDVVIDRTFVAGGGAKLRGMGEAIGSTLGFRVEFGNPWLSVAQGSRHDAAYLESVAPESVAVESGNRSCAP